jgi:ribonuclease HI
MAMEIASQHGWNYLWIESDSGMVINAFTNISVVPWNLRNRSHNCLSLGLNIIRSHIYREGNKCADRLANHGRTLTNFI